MNNSDIPEPLQYSSHQSKHILDIISFNNYKYDAGAHYPCFTREAEAPIYYLLVGARAGI